MITALDLGGSLIKIVTLDNNLNLIDQHFKPAKNIKNSIYELFPDDTNVCIITGGKSRQIDLSYPGIRFYKYHEFLALSTYQKKQYGLNGIICSIGTGCPILEVSQIGFKHLTGTGIGGER